LNKGDYEKALDLALEVLNLAKEIKHNILVGYCLILIGTIYYNKGEPETGLDYAKKSLEANKELDHQAGIALSFWILAYLSHAQGKLIKATEYCKRALSIEKISNWIKINILTILGSITQNKGELNKALKYSLQSIKLAEEVNGYVNLIQNNNTVGRIYRSKGENNTAIKYYKRSLDLSEKEGYLNTMVNSLLGLLLISLGNNSREQALKYVKQLENLADQNEDTQFFKHGYSLGKALFLKNSKRMADKVKAVELLKNVIEDEIAYYEIHILSIVSLCDLLLEELLMYNEPEIINEINPLISQLLTKAERQYSFSWLVEGKLLQAKLALIEMNIEGAQKLLIEAQNIAESHGLIFLSQKISKEHDSLLEQLEKWQTLKRDKAPMSERIRLASVDDVIGRLQGKQTVDPPELEEEEPILLLIMDNSGSTYFNHPFAANWDYSDLFSSFMSAFNTFSSEIFSKSIDRIKVGENTILIHPIEAFLTCYVIKGQSYPALQKLTRFTKAIKEHSEIWQTLNKSVQTSEMLELDNPPALKTVIEEIF
jgi:tetratricopeptide (TPR) repeat protein